MMSILEQSAFHAVAEIPKAIRELAAGLRKPDPSPVSHIALFAHIVEACDEHYKYNIDAETTLTAIYALASSALHGANPEAPEFLPTPTTNELTDEPHGGAPAPDGAERDAKGETTK